MKGGCTHCAVLFLTGRSDGAPEEDEDEEESSETDSESESWLESDSESDEELEEELSESEESESELVDGDGSFRFLETLLRTAKHRN